MPNTTNTRLKQQLGVQAIHDQAYAQISRSLPDIRRIAQDGIGQTDKDRQIIRFLAAFAANKLNIYQHNLSSDEALEVQ